MTTKSTPKPKRYEYHLTYDAARDHWVCKVGGGIVEYGSRNWIIAHMGYQLRWFHERAGQHSELIIHRKDGTIGKGPSSRRTYGGDPKGTKG